jgi:leader peptidase (prepilin peptidase) / N-methyltransferase
MDTLRVVLFVLAGLPIGSFLTVLVHRLPKGQSIVAPRSRCPRCGVSIRARDNVPVLSYLLLRGRWRSGGGRWRRARPFRQSKGMRA